MLVQCGVVPFLGC